MTLSNAEITSMRSTVVRRALSMTCTIQRSGVGTPDAFGQPTVVWPPDGGSETTLVPCFYWEKAEREVVGANVQAVFTEAHIEMEARTDVHAGDRVRDVVASDGFVVADALEIRAVLQRDTVTVLEVEKVT